MGEDQDVNRAVTHDVHVKKCHLLASQCIELTALSSFISDESFMCLTKHEPVGVCGAIIPVSQ